MSFIGDIYTTTATKFAEPVASYASKLGTAAAPLFGAAFGAYIVYQAYKLYTNKDISIEQIIHIIVVFGVILLWFLGSLPFLLQQMVNMQKLLRLFKMQAMDWLQAYQMIRRQQRPLQ
jgi:hypothetical protein